MVLIESLAVGCSPEAVGIMVPHTSLDWSTSVKSYIYLIIIMEKKGQNWPIFAQNLETERSIRIF